mmetsp:Transcript_838/g.1520  ORF Transcript_838/g.1520 Transcript_838/m.1520 type:complete len:80 (-) Transcript_838:355-594(-)
MLRTARMDSVYLSMIPGLSCSIRKGSGSNCERQPPLTCYLLVESTFNTKCGVKWDAACAVAVAAAAASMDHAPMDLFSD